MLASLLVFAAGCSDEILVPTGEDTGGDDGDGGDGGEDGVGEDGECPSNNIVQNVCQADVPVLAVTEDCDSGAVQDGVCQAAAPESGTPADCIAGTTDGLCDPEPPTFASWTCPAGWGVVPGLSAATGGALAVEGATGFSACQAVWNESCADGTLPQVGSNTCADVFDNCPGGDGWPSDAALNAAAPGFGAGAGATIWYVNPNAAGPGDGTSRATAFPTLAAALTAALDSDIIALATGTYELAPTAIQQRVAIVGGCATGTELVASTASDTAPLLVLEGSGSRLIDLSVSGERPGVGVTGSGTQLNRVQLIGLRGTAVTVSGAGASSTLSSVLIQETQPSGATGSGVGLEVSAGGNVNLGVRREDAPLVVTGVAFIANRGAGINVTGPNSNVVGEDVIVTDTLPLAAGTGGQGVTVSAGGNVELTRAALARNLDSSILVQGGGSSAFLTDVFITATLPGVGSGAAVTATGNAQVTVQRLLATANPLGIVLEGAETTLELEDGIVADPAPGTTQGAGTGLWSQGGAIIDADRLVLLRNSAGLVSEAGGSLTLANVVIAGSTGLGISAAGSDVAMTQVTLLDNGGGASFTANATLDVSDTRIVGTRKTGATQSHGLLVDDSGGFVQRLLLARNDEYGVYVSGPLADLDITDLRISDTRVVGAGNGMGLVVTDPEAAPVLVVTRAIITQSHGYGVLVDGPGPQVTLSDFSVTETQAVAGAAHSGGILFLNRAPATIAAGALLRLERGRVDRSVDSGVTISGSGIELDLNDVTISNTGALGSGAAGAGLLAQGGAIVSGVRVALTGNAHTGISAEPGTDLDFTDLLISDTLPAGTSGPSGEGMKVVGATLRVERASLLRNAATSIWAAQAADVELYDVVLDETQAASNGTGVGIDVVASTLSGERVSIARTHGLGLSASLGAQVELTDLSVTQTEAEPSLFGGRGVEVTSGAQVILNRVVVASSRDYAVVVAGPDPAQLPNLLSQFPRDAQGPLPERTTLELYDLSIHDTLVAACAASSCAEAAGGGGIALLSGASLELDTFDIRSSALVGMMVSAGATVDAQQGTITANAAGVNVQGSGVDLSRSFSDVRVFDNEIDNDTRQLPLPSISDLLGRSAGRLDVQTIDSPR